MQQKRWWVPGAERWAVGLSLAREEHEATGIREPARLP